MITKSTFPSGLFPGFIVELLKAIGCHHHVVAEWLCLYIHTRVRRIEARVNKLLDQLRAGTYRAPKPRAPRSPDAPRPDAPRPDAPSPDAPSPDAPSKERRKPDPRAWVFPNIASIVPADARKPGGRFGWVNLLLRDPAHPGAHIYTGPGAAGQLQAILQLDAEIMEFAKTCPALARQLRPLCHMLGVTPPDYLKLAPRPRKPREPKPKREKPKKFKIYKYWMRTGPIFAERQRRFGKKTSKW